MVKNILLVMIALATLFSPVLIKRAESQFRASETFMNGAIANQLQENSPPKMVRKQYWDCTARFGKTAGFFSEGTDMSYRFDPFLNKRSFECDLNKSQWENLKSAVRDFFFYF